MVSTEVAQLSSECNAWRETLRSEKEQFGLLKLQLQKAAGRHLEKDDLLQVEHLDNQLHIQLINIHDLKQGIKHHERRINYDKETNTGMITDDILADHENLYDEFLRLENTLRELRQEYELFMAHKI